MLQYTTAQEAVQLIESHHRVFIHGSAATPIHLVNALFERAKDLTYVELVSISTFGDMHWKMEGVQDSFFMNSLFVSANVREWVNSSTGDYIPVFLSEIPK